MEDKKELKEEKRISEEKFLETGDEISIFDLLYVIFKRKNLILKITGITIILAIIISLILPKVYIAETKILPPIDKDTSSVLISQFTSHGIEVPSGLFGRSTSELFASLATARAVLDALVEKYNLKKVYGVDKIDDARNILKRKIQTKVDRKTGIITIQVEDRDPKRAADLSNSCVEEMRKLMKKLALNEASMRRLFYEEELQKAKEELIIAEEDLRKFQETTKIIVGDKQAETTIALLAQLRAQIAAKEAQIKSMKTYLTENNPDLKKAYEELSALRAQYAALEGKSGGGGLIPVGKAAREDIEYLRKLREFKYRENLYNILLKQYEVAKLDEAKYAPIIQVIEEAIPPTMKAKPKRKLIVIISALTSFFFSIFLAFILESIATAKNDPLKREKIKKIEREINSLIFFKKTKNLKKLSIFKSFKNIF